MPLVDKEVVPSFRPELYVFLKKQAVLDLLEIDEQLSNMPALIQEAAETTALSIEIRDSAKEDLEKAKAEAAERLRVTTDSKGKERSETRITSEVPLDRDVQDKIVLLSAARLDAALWQGMMNSLQTKSSAIRTGADLMTSGFITSNYLIEKRRKEIRNVDVKVNVE